MFDRTENNYKHETRITGVGVTEAAKFLHDVEKEAGGKVKEIVFDRLPNTHIDYAAAYETTAVDGCLNFYIWYILNGNKRELRWKTTIRELEEKYNNTYFITRAIYDDIAIKLSENIIQSIQREGERRTLFNKLKELQ